MNTYNQLWHPHHLLIDVRTNQEYCQSHVCGAKHIPLSGIENGSALAYLNQWPKDHPIDLYCRVGNRSTKAANILRQHGFRQVRSIGGMEDGLVSQLISTGKLRLCQCLDK